MIKQKAYLLLENLDQLKNLKIGFCTCSVILDWYLFQLIILLKTDSKLWLEYEVLYQLL